MRSGGFRYNDVYGNSFGRLTESREEEEAFSFFPRPFFGRRSYK